MFFPPQNANKGRKTMLMKFDRKQQLSAPEAVANLMRGILNCKEASKIDPLDATNFDPTLGTSFYHISVCL